MFEEQVAWAVEAGVDYVIGETFDYVGEALVALDIILQSGLPAVITLTFHRATETREGLTPEDACKRLADAGAAVVGLTCSRGPRTMLPLLERKNGRAHVCTPVTNDHLVCSLQLVTNKIHTLNQHNNIS